MSKRFDEILSDIRDMRKMVVKQARRYFDGDVQAADVTPIGYAGIATASLARVEFDVAQSLDA